MAVSPVAGWYLGNPGDSCDAICQGNGYVYNIPGHQNVKYQSVVLPKMMRTRLNTTSCDGDFRSYLGSGKENEVKETDNPPPPPLSGEERLVGLS